MVRSFYNTREWALWAYGGGALLILSIWVQVQLSVAFNDWYKGFYDLLQKSGDFVENPQEGLTIFYQQLVSIDYVRDGFNGAPSFLEIAIPYILLMTLTSWFTQVYGLRWRQAMTWGYIPRWRNVEQEIEGASQRIQEDCNRFARIIESLGLQIVRAIMTLVAFIPILYGLSDKVDVPYFREVEGSLVWGP